MVRMGQGPHAGNGSDASSAMGQELHPSYDRMMQEIHAMVSYMYAKETEAVRSVPLKQRVEAQVPVCSLPDEVAEVLDFIASAAEEFEEMPLWMPAYEAERNMNAMHSDLREEEKRAAHERRQSRQGYALADGARRPNQPGPCRIATPSEAEDQLQVHKQITTELVKATQDLQQLLRAQEKITQPPITAPKEQVKSGSLSPPLPQKQVDAIEPTEESEVVIDMSSKSQESAKPKAIDEAGDDEVEMHASMMDFKEPDSLASVFLHDDEVDKPMYCVEAFYSKDGMCQNIARSSELANFTVLIVVLNAIYIGVESDHNDAQNIYRASWFFQICSQLFCIYFTWELLVRFFAFEDKRNCLRDGWFKFDAFLVSSMILDTWIIMPTLYSMGGKVTIPTQPLRMLRLFKLTRMARLMKTFPELITMIKGLVRSLRAISSSMILVGLMIYVWAIMMHMLLKDEKKYNDTTWEEWQLGFGTMTQCMWTLLVDGTLMLDNTQPLITGLLFHDKFHFVLAGIAFLAYSLLSALLILQMLIGVLCEVVSQVNQEQRDAAALGLVRQELLGELTKFAGDDGKISQEELFEVMNNPKSRALLKRLNINLAYLLELQKMMFARPGQLVSIKAVLQLMVMCRGNMLTTVETMAGGLLSVIHEITTMKESLEENMKSLVAS